MGTKTPKTGSELPPGTYPERSRLRLLTVLVSSLLLGGAQAQCSFMSGDQRDEDEDKDKENGTTKSTNPTP